MKYASSYTTVIKLLCCLLLGSCAAYTNQQNTDGNIYGSWIWKSSSGGFTGRQTITPESAGYSKVIYFSEDGVYREFHDDELVITAGYTVGMKKTIFGYHEVISFADSTGQMMDKVIMQISETTLYLSEPCPDCFGHTYVRLNE